MQQENLQTQKGNNRMPKKIKNPIKNKCLLYQVHGLIFKSNQKVFKTNKANQVKNTSQMYYFKNYYSLQGSTQ